MADRTMLSFEVDEELGDYVAEQLADGRYPSVGEYLRDLIRLDQEEKDKLPDGHLEVLREAFAAPEDEFRMVSADDVIARGRARRQA